MFQKNLVLTFCIGTVKAHQLMDGCWGFGPIVGPTVKTYRGQPDRRTDR